MKYDKTKSYYLPIEGLSNEQMEIILPLFKKHGTPQIDFIYFTPENFFGIDQDSGGVVKAYCNIKDDIVSFGEFMDVFFDMIREPIFKIGEHVVKFDKKEQKITVGCTTVDKETIQKILKELES